MISTGAKGLASLLFIFLYCFEQKNLKNYLNRKNLKEINQFKKKKKLVLTITLKR
jgi:hypothetical protein